MDEWRERAMNCLVACCAARRAAAKAYVIEAVLFWASWASEGNCDQSIVTRHGSRNLSSSWRLASLAPLLPLLLFLLRMARLALFSIVFLFLSLSANAASSQQPLAYPDGSVHTTEGWSWTDCGQSSV